MRLRGSISRNQYLFIFLKYGMTLLHLQSLKILALGELLNN